MFDEDKRYKIVICDDDDETFIDLPESVKFIL